MENPFKVCHGNDCQENIETYNFKKGESYKIMVKAVKKEGRYEHFLLYQVLHFMMKTMMEPIHLMILLNIIMPLV